MPTQAEVQALLDAYVAAHRACTIVVFLRETSPARGLLPWCARGQRCERRLVYYLSPPRTAQYPPAFTLEFGFKEQITPATSVADVRAKYEYTDFNLPLGGLSAPGWQIYAYPPQSPVHRSGEPGLSFDGYAAPQLSGRLLTTIHAVMANRDVPNCEPLADAPMRPECMATATLSSPVRIEFDLAISASSIDCRTGSPQGCLP
jgi:hypothetical protein